MQCKNNKRLLANGEVCLITQPEIAITLGRSEAIFLQQLHYWLTTDNDIGYVFDGQKWIYNSYKSWTKNIRIFSESTIRRAVGKLEGMGIILTKNMNKKKSDHTKWYTINYAELKELLPSLSDIKPLKQNTRLLKMSRPCVQNEQIINKEPEITSENKTISSEQRSAVFQEPTSKQVNVVEKDNKLIDKNPEYKNNLATELLEIWNQTVEQEESLIQLTKKRAQHLVAAFKYRFESNKLKWKHFCQQVTSSDFLMGKVKSTFKASLDWVLKFDIIQRILEGDFGVKNNFFAKEEQSLQNKESLDCEIQNNSEEPAIKLFRRSVLQTFGSQVYQSWFADMAIREEGRGLVLTAKSRFISDYIQTHYLEKLRSSSIYISLIC